jgi:hypothetical protein
LETTKIETKIRTKIGDDKDRDEDQDGEWSASHGVAVWYSSSSGAGTGTGANALRGNTPGVTTRMFTAGSDLRVIDPSGAMSHFIWRDPLHILAYPDRNRNQNVYLYHIAENRPRKTRVNGGATPIRVSARTDAAS